MENGRQHPWPATPPTKTATRGRSADARARRRKAGIPEEVAFKTKPEIALDQLRWACAASLARGVVLLDAGYGNNDDLRADITALGLTYAAGILSTTTLWAPGARPLPAKPWSGRGRPPSFCDAMTSIGRSVKALALGLPRQAWRTIEWREGAAERLRSRPIFRPRKNGRYRLWALTARSGAASLRWSVPLASVVTQ